VLISSYSKALKGTELDYDNIYVIIDVIPSDVTAGEFLCLLSLTGVT
jgi:hypothetical protein